jgi:hypothetical protein
MPRAINSRSADTLLSSKVSLPQYLALEQQKDREAIADFVYQRFHERYIRPFECNAKKNGFLMMASSCLMIESLESFWQGWKKSPNSALAFCQFFDRNDQFLPLRGYSQQFYANIRCGIMHQSESTGGWHIRRDLDALFDANSLTIDATRFLIALKSCLSDYCTSLKIADWDAEVWKSFRKKMKEVCANVERVA